MFPISTPYTEQHCKTDKREDLNNVNNCNIPITVMQTEDKSINIGETDKCLVSSEIRNSRMNNSYRNIPRSSSSTRQLHKYSAPHPLMYYKIAGNTTLVKQANKNTVKRSSSLGSLSNRPPFYPPGPQSWDDVNAHSNTPRIQRIRMAREWYKRSNSLKFIGCGTESGKRMGIPTNTQSSTKYVSPIQNTTNQRPVSVDRKNSKPSLRPWESYRLRPCSFNSLWSLNYMNEDHKTVHHPHNDVHSPFWCTDDKCSFRSHSHSTESLNNKVSKCINQHNPKPSISHLNKDFRMSADKYDSINQDSMISPSEVCNEGKTRGSYNLDKNLFNYKPYFQSLRKLNLIAQPAHTSLCNTTNHPLIKPSYSTSNLLNSKHYICQPVKTNSICNETLKPLIMDNMKRKTDKPRYRSIAYKSICPNNEKHISSVFQSYPKQLIIHSEDFISRFGHNAFVKTTGNKQDISLLKGRITHDLTFVPVDNTIPWWTRSSLNHSVSYIFNYTGDRYFTMLPIHLSVEH
ncbi:unnamed protein product [Schistosoma rodhaini]|uniref:Non-specific serine/threonine protein kinase n=1 Tax=Schistosoma rodhaini TaxID=6188 RepID=A0A183QLV3_9TREM|nr:unnamed protein product [Schistosoma rodhaini]